MTTLPIRNAAGEISKSEPIVGMWYVGVAIKEDADRGETYESGEEIAQYVGEGEFYDEGCEEPTRMQDYDFIVESHMGKLN